MTTIRNPVEWSLDQLRHVGHGMSNAGTAMHHAQETMHSPAPAVRKIAFHDLREALAEGYADFGAYRSDVIFLCVIYPAIGLVLGRVALGQTALPLVFPLATGFALVGPLAALGLYEMSRRREQGAAVSWATPFRVFRAPAFGPIALLGLILVAIFLLWLTAAAELYKATLGPAAPASLGAFAQALFTTPAGWTLIVVGIGVGFLFALLVLVISVVSFPLMLDRDVGLDTAIATSFRAVRANPGPSAAWGLIVAAALAVGSIPLFIGLIVVLPVLGHATWHLYRKLVEQPGSRTRRMPVA